MASKDKLRWGRSPHGICISSDDILFVERRSRAMRMTYPRVKARRLYVIRGPESKRPFVDPGWWSAMRKEMRLQDSQKTAARHKRG